jgi:hypothetical protein
MSWRDRLGGGITEIDAKTSRPAVEAIGANGAIDNRVFSAKRASRAGRNDAIAVPESDTSEQVDQAANSAEVPIGLKALALMQQTTPIESTLTVGSEPPVAAKIISAPIVPILPIGSNRRMRRT